jgi:hypothetical protein
MVIPIDLARAFNAILAAHDRYQPIVTVIGHMFGVLPA